MTTRRSFSASYFDGKSARNFAADVAVSRQGLVVSISGAEARLWPYGSLRLAQGDQNQPLHLEHRVAGGDENCPEILVVDHPEFALALQEADPSILKLPPRSAIARITRLLTLSCFSLLLLVLCFKYAGPVLVDGMVKIFPYSWEKKLGTAIMAELQPRDFRPPAPEAIQALDSIVEQLLTGTSNPAGYQFHVHIFPQQIVNALALPGGDIIVFQGLLNIAETPEELAGVLAHEMQHILLRHATRNLVREAAVKLFFFLMAGEIYNKALQAAESLVYLRYSREMEAEADREGMRTIIAGGVNPDGMVRIFEKLAAHERKTAPDFGGKKPGDASSTETPSWLKYLSTHPSDKDRVNELQDLARKRDKSRPTMPLLPGMDWPQLRNIAREKPFKL